MNTQKTRPAENRKRFAWRSARAAVVVATCLLPRMVAALDIVWDGEQNTLYTNDMNWVGNTAPRNNDYQDTAIFKENTPANRTPTLSGSRSVYGVRFDDSADWTLGGSGTLYTKSFYSTGTGANGIAVEMEMKSPGANCTVGRGNTLTIKSLRIPNFGINLSGGGTLHLNGQIVGNSSPAAYHININDALLRIAATQPAQASSAYVKINHENARLQLRSTVAAAKSLIGDDARIRDGVGQGLSVTDIGGGYVEVAVAPRPTVLTVR
jgi:hypothetical protein